jgi:DNA-binding NtrC family response regulator
MKTPLNILFAEDVQDDVDLLLAEIRRHGFDPQWKRVETELEFLEELKKLPDIVLSDYSMPQFNGLRAAQLTMESGLNIPFILISGTVGEEVAVQAMKSGATDYLLKDRITRLGMAIQQALEQRRLREERKQSEREIRAQLVELQRWHEAMLSREERILELKTEVNELLAQQQKPARYAVIPPP